MAFTARHESGMRTTNWQFGHLEWIAFAVLAMSAATIIWMIELL